MRLVSRKIWRAYPQLDRFSDEVCRRYVRHAFHARNFRYGVALLIVTGVLAMTGAVAAVYFFFDSAMGGAEAARGNLWILLALALVSVLLASVIWLPALACLMVRDVWLRRVLKQQLQAAHCPGCRYQLVGLAIAEEGGRKLVRCPECGFEIVLNDGHVTEADINPKLLRCS